MVTAGVYLLVRCSPLIEQSELALTIIMVAGAVTTFFAASVGLFQNDIKKVIAYSTMSQLAQEYNKFIIFRYRTIYEKVIINIIYTLYIFLSLLLIKVSYCLLYFNTTIKIEYLSKFLFQKENKDNIIKIAPNNLLFKDIILNNDKKRTLNPYYITGFVDGDGCFLINIKSSLKRKLGYLIELNFKIKLHWKDKELLEDIKKYFDNKGIIIIRNTGHVEYIVNSIKNFKIIINHFEKYPLITQKWSDYQLFKQAFEIIKNKEHLSLEGLKKIISIKTVFNKGLSDHLKKAFPDLIPIIRPELINSNILNPYWISGFVDAEGCFHVAWINNSKGIALIFKITQHKRDARLLKSFVDYFKCGRYYIKSGNNSGDYIVTKYEDINQNIIPFFEKYSLHGSKSLDFYDYKKVAELIKIKAHLNMKGLEQIKFIRSGMNKGRISNKLERRTISVYSLNHKRTYTNLSYLCFSNRNYSILPIKQKFEDDKFNQWLAGLIDGEGQLIVSKKGYANLKIVMSIKDKSALLDIKQKYGGSIKCIAGYNALRYKLHHKQGLLKLINDINGLIRNPTRMLQLNKVCVLYNMNFKEPKSLIYNNGWFSGFIDAEGSIYINEESNQLILSITQKNKYLLDPLIRLYGGRVVILDSKEAFQYFIYRKKEILDLLDNYFKNFPLKSSKKNKLNLIKNFYLCQEYKSSNIYQIDKFTKWIKFKNIWDRL